MPTKIEDQKSAILVAMMRFIAGAGFVAYVPSVYAAIVEGLWAIAVVDTIAYAVVIVVAFSQRIGFGARLWVMVALSIAIGATVLIMTGPYGAGYIWLLVAAMLSALFGTRQAVIISNALTGAFMLVWGALIALGAIDGHGLTPLNVAIIATNLLLISAGLSIVIVRLMSGMSLSLAAEDQLNARLSVQLAESRRIAADLDKVLGLRDAYLKELQHRVRNNMQVVISLIGMADKNDPDACRTLTRRVRALSAVNDLSLSRDMVAGTSAAGIEAAELLRLLATRARESCYPSDPCVTLEDRHQEGLPRGAELDPQCAGLLAIVVSDALEAMIARSAGLSIGMDKGEGLVRVDLRYPPGSPDELAAEVLQPVIGGSLARGAAPDLRLALLPGEPQAGPGLRLYAELADRAL
jgi:hypothetical protein